MGANYKRCLIYDLFLCHASEDKDFVKALAIELKKIGLKVWYDEFELNVGDSLRKSIEKGIKGSHAAVIVLSPAFLNEKKWAEHELNSIDALEKSNRSRIFPIWHGVTKEQVVQYSPNLADRFAVNSEKGIIVVASAIKRAIDPVRGTILDISSFEDITYRFLQGEAELAIKSPKGLVANIFTVAACLGSEEYPVVIERRAFEEEVILNSVYMIFYNYIEGGYIPESYFGTDDVAKDKLWQIMNQYYHMKRPEQL